MKVLWISERFPPERGGVARAAARQVSALAPRLMRLDVLHLSADVPPARVESEEWEGAEVHHVGCASRREESLQLLFQAACLLQRKHGHQLIHGFYALSAGYLAVLVGAQLGRPSVVSLRGNDLDLGMFEGGRASQLHVVLERASAVTAVSQDLLARARLLGASSALHCIPNSVDAELFTPGDADPAELALLAPYPRPWIAFAGELRLKKGLPILCELAADRARRQSGTVFALGGVRRDEQEAFQCWRRAEAAAAQRFVELPYQAKLPALRSLYRAMDLFVFPSLWEGLPNALLEVMACAKPVVATAVGGIGEVIEHSRSGLLVDLGRLEGFTDEVDRVLSLPATQRDALGQAARARICEHFAPSGERDALLALYAGLRA